MIQYMLIQIKMKKNKKNRSPHLES